MNKDKILLLLRVGMGVIFFYAGITKVINPNWSPAGYLENAQTFSGFYGWLASASNLPWVTFLNEWGLTLIGAALILGVTTRFAASLGAILMILYYFPVLNFPYAGDHGYLVDDHIIYALVLCLLAVENAGRKFGLDSKLRKLLPGSLGKYYKKIS